MEKFQENFIKSLRNNVNLICAQYNQAVIDKKSQHTLDHLFGEFRYRYGMLSGAEIACNFNSDDFYDVHFEQIRQTDFFEWMFTDSEHKIII